MLPIQTVTPVPADTLYLLLKTEFTDYVNSRLGSNLAIDYAHVQDIINISFAELSEVTTFTVVVTDDELTISHTSKEEEYNSELLEQHLHDFLISKVS